MVGISPTPLPPAMMRHLNMVELEFLEAKNAMESERLRRKQKGATPRLSSERLKQLRRAVISHSKKMLTKTSSAHRARKSSEKRAKKEAQRRKRAYEATRSVATGPNGSTWYNQPPSFYRGSPSRRRRGKRSSRSARR